jgi:hypothetical protein
MLRDYNPRRSNLEIKKERKELKSKIKELKREKRKIENSDVVNLTLEQRTSYELRNESCKRDEERGRAIFKPYEDEKDYLIKTTINPKIRMYEHGLVVLLCEEKGHDEKVIALGDHGTVCRCDRCGASYTRSMSMNEGRNWYDAMHTPFTI